MGLMPKYFTAHNNIIGALKYLLQNILYVYDFDNNQTFPCERENVFLCLDSLIVISL